MSYILLKDLGGLHARSFLYGQSGISGSGLVTSQAILFGKRHAI